MIVILTVLLLSIVLILLIIHQCKDKFIDNKNIIYTHNINILKNNLKNKKNAYFFGKGPTFKIINKKSNDDFFVCINDSINYINQCDLLVINDIETYNRINPDKYKNLKYILTPYYPHTKGYPNKNLDYKYIFNKIYPNFNGYIIIYNLKTGFSNHKNFINLYTANNGGLNALELLLYYIKNIKNYNFYGIGIVKGNGYSYFFVKNNEYLKKKGNEEYNDSRILSIKNNIIKLCTKYNVNYKLN